MTNIILARHGETEWNVAEIFRGRTDIGLNETGIRQAELLAEYLSGLKIQAIYSSPIKRALMTAETIARHHRLKVEVTPGLIDIDYGEWQGLSHQAVKHKYARIYREWQNSPHEAAIPGGESLLAVRERATGVINEVITRHDGNIILVSHRVVNKVLICALLGLDNSHFWNIRLDTAAITNFAYENGRFILTEHNNTAYLKPIQKPPLSDF